MNKFFFYIAVVAFSTIGFTSCSGDDTLMEIPTPNPNPNVGHQLTIVHNGAFRPLGTQAIFKAMIDSIEITNAVFYVDGRVIPGKTYSQSTIGEVQVQARRAGYADSEFVTIQFAQKPY